MPAKVESGGVFLKTHHQLGANGLSQSPARYWDNEREASTDTISRFSTDRPLGSRAGWRIPSLPRSPLFLLQPRNKLGYRKLAKHS